MTGTVIAQYQILEEVGRGGMGVVYTARDMSLDRIVAIKFLSSSVLSTSEARERFAREARAAASLNHPNGATIFEFAEWTNPATSETSSFIVMEFVEGTTLSTKIAERPLPVADAIRITVAAAEALSKAHEKGIVHRDIKSENIMLSNEGVVKVMDFGLADVSGFSRVTTEGTTLGTVAYMSPEQARGETADARSDLWSLGIVLYEMVTGKQPFRATYEQALVYQILNDEPEPVTSLRSNVPLDLERIVAKLIRKDPADRYQSAKDLLVDLRSTARALESGTHFTTTSSHPSASRRIFSRNRILVALGLLSLAAVASFFWPGSTDSGSSRISSLAVLPFENITHDPDQEYFADGMTDQLISELCKIHSVRVISRTSAMQFKGKHESVTEIARTLDVEGVVTATVFRSGERMRVNVQLIRARDERALWGDSYERKLEDVLDLTSTLAQSIASEVQVALTPAESQALSKVRPVEPEAFDLVARGNYLLNSSADKANLEKALELMQKAVEIDPGYPDGYIGVAYAGLQLNAFGFRSGSEILDHAKASIDRAMELDPSRGRAYTLRGQILWMQRDIPGCMAAHSKAVQLSPNDGLVRTLYSWILMAQGRFQEGIHEAEIAVTLDPLSLFARCNLMGWYYSDHRYEDARREAGRILEMDPHWAPALDQLVWIAVREGRLDDAVSQARKLWMMTDSLAVPSTLSWQEYQRWVVRTIAARKRDSDVSTLAMYSASMGDRDRAMAYLERAAELANPVTLCLFYPEFDSLRSDPRFAEFVSKIKLPVSAYCSIDQNSP